MDNFLKFSIKNNLLVVCVLLVFFLILFSNVGLLPIDNLGDFLFFVILAFAFALYRPGWAFLFFIGAIVLENITLIPEEMSLTIRPYQLLGFLILLAIVIRFFTKRLNFTLPKLRWYDAIIILVGISGFLNIIAAENRFLSLKLSFVICSFIALYFLTRVFVQGTEDVSKIIPFFLGSSLIVTFYGIWQNILFLRGLNSFEVMPGRPNATFTEADWFGLFLVLLVTVIYVVIYKFNLKITKNQETISKQISISNTQPVSWRNRIFGYLNFDDWFLFGFCILFLVVSYITLILTVSRSAWLGAGIASIFFAILILFRDRNVFWKTIVPIFLSGIFSLVIVYAFQLTNFQLFNRAVSTGGLQKITIACEADISLPEKINNISELEKYTCQHINLEDINQERDLGHEIREIYRTDPNVNIRSEIYKKSWQQIRMHPILGIGWGNIGDILGKDERGAGLNSSNIFLEIWLGSGILGLIAFLSVWVYILLKSVYGFFKIEDNLIKVFSLFTAISWLGLTIANLFNAGIMLGFVWVYMAITLIDYKKDANRN